MNNIFDIFLIQPFKPYKLAILKIVNYKFLQNLIDKFECNKFFTYSEGVF
jgi:hypothetical protein